MGPKMTHFDHYLTTFGTPFEQVWAPPSVKTGQNEPYLARRGPKMGPKMTTFGTPFEQVWAPLTG